jgi:hypothetical protein
MYCNPLIDILLDLSYNDNLTLSQQKFCHHSGESPSNSAPSQTLCLSAIGDRAVHEMGGESDQELQRHSRGPCHSAVDPHSSCA